MTQQTSPFVETKFGWDFGESNWNTGMDENLLKFSYLHDSNINAIVASLPAPVNGEAYFRTTDRRVHFVVNGSFVSTPIPIWHELTIKSTGKKYTYNGTALTPSKTLSTINVADYGAVGDGVTDNYAAFQAALAHVRITLGGGRIVIPKGTYKLSKSWRFFAVDATGYHDYVIQGEGSGTVLDFSSPAFDSDGDGVKFVSSGGKFVLSDLVIRGATNHGLSINADITIGDQTKWIHSFSVRNVTIKDCGLDGAIMAQTYMGNFDNVGCWNNGRSGFRCLGYHTSMNFNACWAMQDVFTPSSGAGWYLNGMTYSTFSACGVDNHGGSGWRVSNIAGVTWDGCGSESNGGSGWALTFGGETGLPSACLGINGAVLDGCFSLYNSNGNPGLQAAHLSVGTASNRPATVTMRGNKSIRGSGADNSLVLYGDSGKISIISESNNFDGPTIKRNSVYIKDSSLAGTSTLVRLITGSHASISNITESPLPLFEMVSNNMNATFTNGGITIPKGVNRIKITVGVDWAENLTGFRAVRVFKTSTATSPSFVGAAASKTPAADSFVTQNVSTAIIDVNEGDFFGVAVTQNSGSSLQVRSSPLTFMSVEVMG